jgi:hypothetical protein
VFEVKASLTAESAREAIKKLAQLSLLANYLPPEFSCNTFFYDLAVELVEKQTILPNLIPSAPIRGYWGGVILRCQLDQEMTGVMEVFPRTKAETHSMSIPLAKDLDSLEIGRDANGNVVLRTQGDGVMAFSDGKEYHFAKMYGPTAYGTLFGIRLNWSHNNFARFALDLLSRLDGVPPKDDRRYIFGQIFDVIDTLG